MSIATPQARSYASYGAQFSGCYDVIFPRDMVTDAETSWLRTVLPARGRRVVELGVGNGRVALPLAAAFAADRTPVEYIGIDISAEMLHGLAHHDVDGLVTPLRLDIASDDYPPDADAILCVCGTISMLTDYSAQQGVFDRAFAALREGGVFVVETHNAELVRQMHPHPHRSWAVALPGERRMLATFSDLIDGHNWQLEHCLIDNGSATFLHEDSRVTTLAELDAYARNAGLLPIRHSGGLNGDEITSATPTVTALYEKPGVTATA